MTKSPIAVAALIPNPALRPLAFLIGEWRTQGTHPVLPGTVLPGRTSFAWHEGGAFLIMRSEIDEPRFPSGIAIIGSADSAGTFGMLYFDERGTSRIYDVAVAPGAVSWSRDDPDFAQSLTITADADGTGLTSFGRLSKDGAAWEDDLSQIFVRSDESAS